MNLPSAAGSFVAPRLPPEACRPNEVIGKGLKELGYGG
jgi:hypothetical protein